MSSKLWPCLIQSRHSQRRKKKSNTLRRSAFTNALRTSLKTGAGFHHCLHGPFTNGFDSCSLVHPPNHELALKGRDHQRRLVEALRRGEAREAREIASHGSGRRIDGCSGSRTRTQVYQRQTVTSSRRPFSGSSWRAVTRHRDG